MYTYRYIDAAQLLWVAHWGEFVGAESFTALRDIVPSLTTREQASLRRIAFDLVEVNRATLHDTDGAYQAFALRTLQSLLPDIGKLLIARLVDESSDAGAVLIERNARAEYAHRVIMPIFSTKKKFLEYLDLPATFQCTLVGPRTEHPS